MLPSEGRLTFMICEGVFPGLDLYHTDSTQHLTAADWGLDDLSVDPSVDDFSVDELSVDDLSVDDISVDDLSADELSVDDLCR